MNVRALTVRVTNKAIILAGSTAGTVTDPAASLSKATAFARKPAVVLGGAALMLADLAGRASRWEA